MVPPRFGLLRPTSLLVVALFAVGCANGPEIEPVNTSKAGLGVLRMRWVKRLGPELPNFMIPEMVEEHDRFNPIELSSAGFDTDKRRAFIGAAVGGLYCLDIRNGNTVWRYSIDDAVGSTPFYDQARKWVYFGADDGRLYALHARSGRLIWSVETGSEIRRGIAMREDTLYVANADSSVMAFDPENGELVWKHRKPPIQGFSSSGYADIVFHDQTLLAAFSDGTISALDPISGSEIWSNDLAAEVVATTEKGEVNLVDADATPVVVEGVAVAASIGGGMYGIDATSGNVLWTRPDIDRASGLAEANGLVFAARAGLGLTAVDPHTGRVMWHSRFGLGVLQDPVVHEDVMLISDSEAGLFVVSTSDGRVLQRVDQREGFFARPSTHAGYLLIMGNRSTLYAMSVN